MIWTRFIIQIKEVKMQSEPILGSRPTLSLVKATTNYFNVSVSQVIWKYHIKAIPEPPEFKHRFLNTLRKNLNFQNFLKTNFKIYYISNFTLYSPSDVVMDLKMMLPHEGNEYELSVISSGMLCPSDIEANNVYGRFIRQLLNKFKMQRIGKCQFEPWKEKVFTERNFKVWPGFSTIMNYFDGNFLLNIDMCFKVLRMETVLEHMTEFSKYNSSKEDLKNSLIGTSVITSYNNKIYRVSDINFEMTPVNEFVLQQNSKNISYLDYYKNKYNRKITSMNQPLIVVNDKRNGDPSNKIIYLLPELCCMTGLADYQRNDFNCMRDLAKITKPLPEKRLAEATNFVKSIKEHPETKKIINDWHIDINPSPFNLDGYKLSPGNILLGKNKNSQTMREMISLEDVTDLEKKIQKPMHTQPKISKWAIFFNMNNRNLVTKFINVLKDVKEMFEYDLEAPKEVEIPSEDINEWISRLSILDCTVDLVVFVLNGKKNSSRLYSPLKAQLISKYPIPSQMILSSTLQREKNFRSVVNNILIQICAKVGGIPWAIDTLPFIKSPTMVVGIILKFNPKKKTNTFFSFCSTVDHNLAKYWSNFKIFSREINVSDILELSIEGAIAAFQTSNGVKPSKVIVYRDGVSDSGRNLIVDLEVSAFRRTFKRLNMNPDLIFICVNNRVNTKFFIGDNLQRNEYSNPKPGVIFSNKITSDKDFYLISHLSKQGTSSPSHYYVLANDMDEFAQDDIEKLNQSTRKVNRDIMTEIQLLTFKLCYLYYNCVGSIKTPAPIQYAHRLCDLITDKLGREKVENTDFLAKKKCLFFI